MSIILKEEASNSIPTPSSGKTTLFVDDNGVMSIKNDAGAITTFPTLSTSNTQVLFTDGTAIGGDNDFVYNKNTNVLTLAGNLAAANVKTDNLLYANGVPWDLSDPGGSNTQIQFNDDESFGGSAALTFNKSSNAVTMSGNLSAGNVSATLLTGTLTTAAQPNVTSVGTLSGLAVTANITAGNVYANSGVIGASVLTGTLSTSAQPNITSVGSLTSLTVTGNANVGNIGGNNGVFTTVSGTLSTASQPNITSVGTLSALGVNGNLTASNINANTGAFYGNGAGLTNIPGGNITGNITGNISNANFAAFAAEVTDASQPNITSVGTLVDLTVTGNASAGNVNTAGKVVASTLESNVTTGTAPFVVASTTKVTNLNADLLDGFSTATAATGNTVVIRDADGSFSANIITATLSGAATTAGTVTTAAQPNITSVGSLTSLTVTGNASAGNISTGGVLSVTGNANVGNIGATNGVFTSVSGNGSALTALNASNISTGTLAQARLANASLTLGSTTLTLGGTTTTVAGLTSVTSTTFVGALTGAATTAGTVTTAAQPNITSTGTLTSLAVTGNISAGNVSATTFTGALSGAATTAGTVTTAAQPNITSVGTLTSLGVSGTVTASAFTANTGVFTGSGSGLTTLNASNISSGTLAQARLANASVTLGSTALTLGSTVTTVAGLSSVTSTTFVGALTGAATTAGTVTTAAQPNITSVGTLTSLTVSGGITNANITTGANSTAGSMTGNWSLTAGSRLNATYADLAEKYVADADYEAGAVLVFGGVHEVTLSTDHDSHRVAGVVSTNPAYTMNNDCAGAHVATIALQGRVPVKVHGPVAKGDLMVSGPDGRAVANNMARAGTILGKALENFEGGSGVIEVAVGRF